VRAIDGKTWNCSPSTAAPARCFHSFAVGGSGPSHQLRRIAWNCSPTLGMPVPTGGNCGNSVLGAARRRRAIQVFAQCATWAAPCVGFAIRLVLHVPVPWRSLLSRPVPCFGPAGTRAFEYPYKVQDGMVTIQVANCRSGSQPPLFREQTTVRRTERVDFHREQVVRLQRTNALLRKTKDMGVIGQIGQWFDHRCTGRSHS